MMSDNRITWLLETDVFDDRHSALQSAALALGHAVVHWDDEWWQTGRWPKSIEDPVVFHGSLGNAHRIRSRMGWAPGAFCNTSAFLCSNWYRQVSDRLLNDVHVFSTVRQFTDSPDAYFDELGCSDAIFVRPDSPLKPFSGRVLSREKVSLRSLDHGFYYDDETLPIVLSRPREVDAEWRFVVVGATIVAGSAYDADGRRAGSQIEASSPEWDFARNVAQCLDIDDPVYVLDICESRGTLRMLELNPFSGADLYCCDRRKIVEAVAEIVSGV